MVNSSNKVIKVLHLENKIQDGELIYAQLQLLSPSINYKRIETKCELEFSLEGGKWDVVLSDYDLDFFNVYEALNIVHSKFLELPFIVVSHTLGEEIVVDVMKAGAEDFVCKSRPERLLHVMRRTLRDAEIKEKASKTRIAANKAFAAKEQMIAVVSHDIKNPLSAIQLEAQMLLRLSEKEGDFVSSETVQKQMRRVLKTTDRLKTLISDLLDRNKSEDGLASLNKALCSPHKILQDVLDGVRSQLDDKDIILNPFINERLSEFSIDQSKIFQVFSNLLSNAIKFTPRRGVIEIHLDEREGELVFMIQDSGPGLLETERSKVFEKYWAGATSCSGTGLGLFICKIIVEAHGGQISVESGNTRGAIFKFTIPRSVSPYSRSILQAKNDTRKQVLLVDDDDDLRDVISYALSKEGFQVWSYHHPYEAIQCLNEGLTPHLMVVDFHMDGMKGSEFLVQKQLNSRKEVTGCPVVMISACPEEVVDQVPKELYREVLTKPIDMEGLIQQIRLYS